MREKFNLENFLAGKYERVETKIGHEVFDLTYFPKAQTFKLAGIIDDDLYSIDTWTIKGNYDAGQETDFDLFGILKSNS